MSNIGVHDFAIPHDFVRPTRDMIIIRLPLPPKMVGSIEIPTTFRDMAQYNVMVGRLVAMGPLAFVYKNAEGGMSKEDVKKGDWVTFRPYAGTQTMGGKVAGAGSWRYISSFSDVIGVIPADKMPDPSTLIWDDNEDLKPVPKPKPEPNYDNTRERIKV